jgi:hypothetical protein
MLRALPPSYAYSQQKEHMSKQPQLIGKATQGGCMVMAGSDTVFLTRHYEECGHPVMDVLRIPISDIPEVTKLLCEAGAAIAREQRSSWQTLVARGEVF